MPDRTTLSFKKGDKEFPNLTILNSKDKVKVTVSASGIPDALEGRVEAKLAQDTSQIPTVSKPDPKTEAQTTKDITLSSQEDIVHPTALYVIEAKLFVRLSGTSNEWVVAKTASRQYARYFFSTDSGRTASDMLEIKYDQFIVAKGGAVTLTIKDKYNVKDYKRIAFELKGRGALAYMITVFAVTMADKKTLNDNPHHTIDEDYFASKKYAYDKEEYQLTLSGLKKDTVFRFVLVEKSGLSTSTYLPTIFVTDK